MLAASMLARRRSKALVTVVVLMLTALIATAGPSVRAFTSRQDAASASYSGAAAEYPNKSYLPSVSNLYDPAGTLLGIESPGVIDAQRAQKIRDLGGTWVRRNRVNWSAIDAGPGAGAGRYNFSSSDALLSGLAGSGLKPILAIGDNPTWTGATRGGPLPESALAPFAEFLTALVNRYKDAPYYVKHWEIYNEPDNTWTQHETCCGRWGGHGREYATMLRYAYGAIKAADPAAQVLFGSLALDWFVSEGGAFDSGFLDDALANGAGQYFDIMGFHYYPDYDTGRDRWGKNGWNGWDLERGTRGVVGKATFLREKMKQYGVDKAIFCTEVGFSSAADRQQQIPNRTSTDPTEEQSRFLVRVFARGTAAQIQSMIWYLLVSAPPGVPSSADFFAYHGLLDYRLNPLPSYRAYQVLGRELARTRYVRALSPGETGSADVEGYVYQYKLGGKEKWVVWANVADPARRTVVFPADTVRLTQKEGTTSTVRDGGVGDADGKVDGRVTLSVNGSPVFMEAY